MGKSYKKSENGILRQKAEEILHRRLPNLVIPLNESEILKLIYELEVYQIEVEMQNEEIIQAKEQAINAINQKYEKLYNSLPSAYFTLSIDGEILDLNLSGSQMLGKERSNLTNSKFGFFVSDDTKPIFNLFIEKIFISEIIETCQITLKTNHKLPLQIQLSGIINDDRKECLLTAIDITEQKQLEEEIFKQKKFFEQMFTQSSVSTQILDKDGWCERINPKLSQIFGVRPEHIEGKVYNIFKDEAIKQGGVLLHLEKVFNEGKTAEWDVNFDIGVAAESQNIIVDKKRKVWYNNWAYPIFDELDQLSHVIIQHNDITDRKQAEEEIKHKNEELQKINSEKDKFFSIIAHDLRSPFNGFLGLTQLMAEELSNMTLDKIQKIAIKMNDSASNLYKLLENLLEWSRIQQGLISYEPKNILLLTSINESIAIVYEHANNKNIEIIKDIPENLEVFADNNMLQLIIRNLVSNAVKFTHKGGKINISSKINYESIEIAIKDNGIGMNNKTLDNILKLNLQENRLGTDDEPSSGLGLILCKEFIEKHGGKLWIESKEGKGSTFYFTLPFSKE